MRLTNIVLAVVFFPLLPLGYVLRVASTLFLAGWMMATDSLDDTARNFKLWKAKSGD